MVTEQDLNKILDQAQTSVDDGDYGSARSLLDKYHQYSLTFINEFVGDADDYTREFLEPDIDLDKCQGRARLQKYEERALEIRDKLPKDSRAIEGKESTGVPTDYD